MLRRLRLLGLLIVCACHALPGIGSAAAPAPAPALWAGLPPGSHSVGYRRLTDTSPTVHIWYPAKPGHARLTFAGYLDADSADVRGFLTHTGVDSVTVDRLFAARLAATLDAAPEGKASPLVLVAQGNGHDAADQVVLCEYLASNGYVVASTPSPMRRTPLEREDQVGDFSELQARELAGVPSRIARIAPVDTTRLAVIGHSFGARPALLVAMNNPRVRAIVSLDGGIGTATAREPFENALSFHAQAKLPPLLHFYETLDPFMQPDSTLLVSLHVAELSLRTTQGMHHVHFSTYGFEAAVFPDIARVTHATPETTAGVTGVAKQTLAFLKRLLH